MSDTEPSSTDTTPGEADPNAEARKLILRCGYASAAVALIPIPGVVLIGVTPIHVGLVLGLGSIYGAEMGRDSAVALVARIGAAAGASYLGSRLALALGKMVVPVVPGLLGAPVIFANTLAIGTVAKAHFEGREELNDDEVRELYRSALAEAKSQFDRRKVRSKEAEAAAQEAVDQAQEDEEQAALE
jgi:uncharacterized protein (DUF697 family)